MDSQAKKQKEASGFLRRFWQNHESKIVVAIGMILVAIISFEAGILKGQKWQQAPLVVEKTPENCSAKTTLDQKASERLTAAQTQNLPPESKDSDSIANIAPTTKSAAKCLFVGSKNSNKYHLPTCRWAKQIKPENIVCFSSHDDAAARGYQADKNCIK